MKLTKKVKYFENGQYVEREIPLKGKELIEAKKEQLLEKVANGNLSEEEKQQLLLLYGRDPDYITAMKKLTEEIKQSNNLLTEAINKMNDVLSALSNTTN